MGVALAFRDFVPKLLKEADTYSTLALTGDVAGPKYETFDVLVERCNGWLGSCPHHEVVSCEVVELRGSHSLDGDDADEEEDGGGEASRETYMVWINALRVWYVDHSDSSQTDMSSSMSCHQVGYINILPTRLESTPRAFGPKFQTLPEALESFNQRWRDGYCTVPGRIVRLQTCAVRFSPRHCSVDAARTSWLAADRAAVHSCHFLRLFYVVGEHVIKHMEPGNIGFRDFPPTYACGSRPRRVSSLATRLPQQVDAANAWLSEADDIRLLNMQLTDSTAYFSCLRDMPGQESGKLTCAHHVLSYRGAVYHTRVLRVFYLSAPPAAAPPPQQTVVVKAFHVPMAHNTASSICSDLWGPQLFSAKYHKVTDQIRGWLSQNCVQRVSVETAVFTTSRGAGTKLSALHTHTEESAGAALQLHAVLLYLPGAGAAVDARPVPKYFSDATAPCVLL